MKEDTGLRRVVVAIVAVIVVLFGSFGSAFALPSFFDDFSSGTLDNWEVFSGEWSVVDGELSQGVLDNSYLRGQIAVKDLSIQDFIIEAKVKFVELYPSGWAYVGFAVRHTDADSFYWIVLKQTADEFGQPNSNLKLELRAKFNYLVVVDLGFVGQLNTFYNLKAEVNGNNFKIYVNDKLKIQHNDDTFGGSGKILMWTGRCRARFDDVLVINPIENVVPEPGPVVIFSIFVVAVVAYMKVFRCKESQVKSNLV